MEQSNTVTIEGLKLNPLQKPSVGRIVLFEPGENDLAAKSNCLQDGEILPAVIVRVYGDTCVNLRVLTDGPDVLWRTSVTFGTGPYTWCWPERT